MRNRSGPSQLSCSEGEFLGHYLSELPSFYTSWCGMLTRFRYLLEYQEEIVRVCCLDSGKTRVDALFGEILVTAEKLQWTIDHGEKALTPTKRPTNLLMFYKSNTVIYEPLGVVAACVSWNYPFHNFISPIISAIFAGNAIVVKPSEQTAWSSVYFTNIVKGAIAQCGHSQNIVQTVVCLPEAANHLTSHPDISHITFIGSRNVALEVCKSAAKSLTPVTVELGGKDPAVILDDKKTVKDLPGITSILMRGVFQSAGQNCIGIERVIALPGVYDRLIKIVLPLIKAMRLGSVLIDEYYVIDDPENVDYKSEIENKTEGQEKGEPFGENPQQEGGDNDNDNEQEPAEPPPPRLFTTWANTDMGAMINSNNFSTLELLISKAVSQGARLLTGGTRYAHPTYPWGSYFSPTLLADVTPDMEIAQTEVFGPIFLLMKAEDVTQAIDIANSTPYALGAGVFGRNKKDVEKCVSEIKAGMVSVNDFGSFYATQLPFGGVKGSGYGRFAGEEGLRAVCNIKSISRDRWPGLIQTRIPELLDYPLRDSWEAWEMVQGIVEMGYAPWKGKVAGVKRMLSAMKRAWKIPKVTLEAVVIEETREDDPDKQDDDDEDGKGSEEAVVVEKAVDLDAVD